MPGSVIVAPEVSDGLPPLALQRLSDELTGEFTCVRCGLSGSTSAGEDVSVLLFRHPDHEVFKAAHATCLPSRIVEVGTLYAELAGEGAGGVRTWAIQFTRPAGGLCAALLFDPDSDAAYITEGGEVLDPHVEMLLDVGFGMVLSPTAPIPRLAGWKLELDRATGTGHILTDDRSVFLDRLPDPPRQWLDLAVRQQEIAIYSGRGLHLSDMARSPESERGQVLISTLVAALSAGNLVAGRVQVISRGGRSRRELSKDAEARRTVAAALETAMAERACPGQPAQQGINALPEIAPLPGRPVMTPVSFQGQPLMIVDLAAGADHAAATEAVLQTLRAANFKRMRAWTDAPLTYSPEGWSYLLWPSQIAVVINFGFDGTPQVKFLFEPFTPVEEWYELISPRDPGPIGLLVGNMHLPPLRDHAQFGDALSNAMASQEVVGATLLGLRMR